MDGLRSFCIDQGAVAEAGPWLWHGEIAGGYALVVLDATNPEALGAARLAIATIRAALDDESRSVTTRLIEALRRTHERILDFNGRTERTDRCGFAITVLVARGNDLYFGQAGPAESWGLRRGQLWHVAAGHPDEGNGLGWLGFDPGLLIGNDQLTRADAGDVERVVVGGRVVGQALSRDAIRQLLTTGAQEAASSVFRACRQARNLGVIVADPPTIARQLPAVEPEPEAATTRARELTAQSAPQRAAGAKRRPAFVSDRSTGPASPEPRQKPRPGSKQRPRQEPRFGSRLVTLGLVVMIGLVLVGVLGVGSILIPRAVTGVAGIGKPSFADAMQRAQQAYDRALTENDRQRRRERLQEAERLVAVAVELRPMDNAALALQERVRGELRTFDGIVILDDVRVLVDGAALGGLGATIDRIFMVRSTMNLLDLGRDRLFGFVTTGRGELTSLIRAPDKTNQQPAIGRLADAFLIPEGGLRTTQTVAVVDRERRFFSLDTSGQLRPMAVRNPGGWREMRRALGYLGNLYILDPAGNQIWRYFPTESGYDSEPRGMLPTTSLTGAVDFAIDGSFYVLSSQGWLRRYNSAGETALKMEGIDRPLSNPSSVFTSADHRYIYIADRGNRRIVVLDKDGRFFRQYQSDQIGNPTDVIADERNFRLYIVSDNRLYQAPLVIS